MTYTITNNTQYGSIEIYFDCKPSEAIRDALKLLRFRWHGVKKCWYGFAAETTVRNTILEACEGQDTVVTDGYLGATAVYGAKCREYLHGSELSAAIRADLKACGIKGVSVSCKPYAGGQGVTATITTTAADLVPVDEFIAAYRVRVSDHWVCTEENPSGILVDTYFYGMTEEEQEATRKAAAAYEYNQAATTARTLNHYHLDRYGEYTAVFMQKVNSVNNIIRAYRYDDSNSMVDYFDTNFYYDIKVNPAK